MIAFFNIDLAVDIIHRRSQGVQRVQVHPQGDKKIFSRHFCWNDRKMGLTLVRCTPTDEIET